MLPFTKRPGRENENEEDVLTKDSLAKPPASIPPPPRSAAPQMRAAQPSVSDDEMTNIMPSKALGAVEAQLEKYASPRPAAGMPPAPRSAPASVPPPAKASSRSMKSEAEEDDPRTVVRGAPKIVKRTNAKTGGTGSQMSTMPTTISPAAVIKASLESANAGRKDNNKKTGDHLMAPPPADLLEDLADLEAASKKKPEKPVMDPHPADVGAEHTAILQTTGTNSTLASAGLIQGVQPLSAQQIASAGLPAGSIPPGSARPMSAPPPPNSGPFTPNQSGGYAAQSGAFASQSGAYASQSGGYPAPYSNPVPSASVSVPGMATSMPAHFMVPQAPYSDARVDPPGTAVTARTKVKGRAPMSWAVALLAFGVFVGVGWVAVQRGGAGGLETTASFVDPAKAGAAKAAAAPATPTPQPVPANTEQPASVSAPAVAVPVAPPPVADPAAPPAVATNAAPSTPPASTTTAAQPAQPAAVAAGAPAAPAKPEPVAAATPTPKKTTHFVAPTPAPAAAPTEKPEKPAKPVKVAAAPAEEAAPAEKPAKGGKGGKPAAAGKGGGEVDEETKKALEALQKSQLESSF
ncbi:MAG: hypothetical protein JST00_30070 [Deltaproteobacteria bacterium]|nr:hypothetical protein [Deltaproteobacteria bacterium]